MPMKTETAIIGAVGLAAAGAVVLYAITKAKAVAPPPGAPSLTVNQSTSPITIDRGATLAFYATGTPNDGVAILYTMNNSASNLGRSTLACSACSGSFSATGFFIATGSPTNDTSSNITFYAVAQDTTTGAYGNFVEITVTTTTAPPPTQIPAAIDVAASTDQYPYWMLYIHNTPILGCSGPACTGYEGNDLSTCQFVAGECNGNNFGMQITGSVVDSAGNPVPNVPLQFTDSRPANDEYPWSTPDNMFGGHFRVFIDYPSATDASGNFVITVTVSFIETYQSSGLCGSGICTMSPVPSLVSMTVTGYVSGTTIEAITVINLHNTICEWIDCS